MAGLVGTSASAAPVEGIRIVRSELEVDCTRVLNFSLLSGDRRPDVCAHRLHPRTVDSAQSYIRREDSPYLFHVVVRERLEDRVRVGLAVFSTCGRARGTGAGWP